MSGSTSNLAIPYIAASQNQKEVTANAAFDLFDKAITETLTVSLASASQTVTTPQAQQNARILATGAATAGRTVTLPAVKRLLLLAAAASNTASVAFVRGSTSIAVAAGDRVLVYIDGTANGMEVVASFGGSGSGFLAAASNLSDVANAATSRQNLGLDEWYGWALGDETTNITTGTALVTDFLPRTCTLLEVYIGLTTPSSSGVVTVDVRLAGSTIFSTKPSIGASQDTSLSGSGSVAGVLSTTSGTKGQKLTFNIDAAGTGAKGLKVWMRVRY